MRDWLVRLGIFFLGWRRKPPVLGGGGALPGDDLRLPHVLFWLVVCDELEANIFFHVSVVCCLQKKFYELKTPGSRGFQSTRILRRNPRNVGS